GAGRPRRPPAEPRPPPRRGALTSLRPRPDEDHRPTAGLGVPCDDRPMQEQRPDPADDHESAYELLQRGHDLMNRRHHAQAAVVLERAARLEPGKGSILEAL